MAAKMKIEDQVCSLELAKRLKELGVKQKSLFYWTTFENHSSPIEKRNIEHKTIIGEWEKSDYKERSFLKKIKFYSAFTVAELGEMLPAMISGAPLEMLKGYIFGETKPTYCARYFNADLIGEPCEKEADARAKMLIYLLENGLIKNEKN